MVVGSFLSSKERERERARRTDDPCDDADGIIDAFDRATHPASVRQPKPPDRYIYTPARGEAHYDCI